VATVTISPKPAGVEPGDTLWLTAELRDAAGNLMSGRRVTWTSSAPDVVSVDSTGRVTRRCLRLDRRLRSAA